MEIKPRSTASLADVAGNRFNARLGFALDIEHFQCLINIFSYGKGNAGLIYYFFNRG